MGKKKNSSVLQRQWSILQKLNSTKAKSASSIMKELIDEGQTISLRTIERDLISLSEIFPIICKEGRPNSWKWAESAKSFSIPGMTKNAALTLKMVQDFANKLLPNSIIKNINSSFEQADNVLNSIDAEKYKNWQNKVRIVSRNIILFSPDIKEDVLNNAYDALFKNKRIRAEYQKRNTTELAEYELNPLGLIIADGIFYLCCTAWTYNNILLFALHRFSKIELLQDPAVVPENFSLNEYLKNGCLTFPNEGVEQFKIKFLIDKNNGYHLLESPLSQDQSVTNYNESKFLIEATTTNSQQIRWWLRAFGSTVEVLEPKSLRDEFIKLANDISNIYSK